MLLSLNDDCIRFIGEYLTLEDQMSLAHVCQRLQLILEDIWHHSSRKVKVSRDQCQFLNNHKNYFYEFMRCISDNVEELEFDRIESTFLHSLKNCDFPKVKSLNIEMLYVGKANYDQDIKIFVKLFPQLTKLTICGEITGQFLWQFKNLEELHLLSCESLRTKHFKKIFTTLRLKKLSLNYYGYNTSLDERIIAIADCTTLEELDIDDHHLLLIIGELLKLKRLRKITTYTRDYDKYLLQHISKYLGNAMDTIIFRYVFWSHDEHCESVQKMVNLRRLIISDDDITDTQLYEIGKRIGNSLEEFYFINLHSDVVNEQGLLNLLSECLNLKIFQMSNTKIDIEFVGRIAELIRSQRGKRKTKLLLRCDGTRVTHVDLESLLLPEMLEITLDKSIIELPGNRCIQCEWRPQCDN